MCSSNFTYHNLIFIFSYRLIPRYTTYVPKPPAATLLHISVTIRTITHLIITLPLYSVPYNTHI
jgi:hypothetical protein